MSAKELSLKTKIGYGVCDMGGNMFFTVVAFWLMNYLTDTVGLAAGLAGTALMIGRVWDAITDPLVGNLSDKTETRWGRRRPYMFIGSIFLLITMIIMFTNPRLAEQTALFWWAALAYCALCTAYTLVNIPYSSLTPELTSSYNERTSLNAYRMSFAIIGTLIGAGAAFPIISAFSTEMVVGGITAIDNSSGFAFMGALFGALMLLTAMITVFAVKEPPRRAQLSRMNLWKSYLSAFRNKPFLLILLPWTFNMTGLTILSSILIYYFKYIYNREDMTTFALLILLLSSMAFIPVWNVLSRKIGKKKGYMAGMLILATMITLIFFFGHTAGIPFFLVLMFFSGIGFATGYIFPWAIVPDAIDYDYLLTGEKREGIFYGLWTFSSKLGQALAASIVGWVLNYSGFIANAAQGENAVMAIRLLLGPIAIVFYLLAALVLAFYPIDEKMYGEIRAKVAEIEQ